MNLRVRRDAGIGDAVCATIVADKLLNMGHEVLFETNTQIVPVLSHHPRLKIMSRSALIPHIDLNGAYENRPDRRTRHFHDMFFDAAREQVRKFGIDLGFPESLKPELVVSASVTKQYSQRLEHFARPWIFICPGSKFYNVRRVADAVWREAAPKFPGTKFWIGIHPAPLGVQDLMVRKISDLTPWISCAQLLVTGDTGPMHIAGALGVPMVIIEQSSDPKLHLLPGRWRTIAPDLDCLNCQKNICPISRYRPPCQYVDPDKLVECVKEELAS
jgi:ADP-heptose:LPS heptosyltransferase